MEGELQRRMGCHLRAFRTAKGLSQEAFGELIGRHRTYIGSLERGERNVSLRTLEQWADRLGVDPLSLLQPID